MVSIQKVCKKGSCIIVVAALNAIILVSIGFLVYCIATIHRTEKLYEKHIQQHYACDALLRYAVATLIEYHPIILQAASKTRVLIGQIDNFPLNDTENIPAFLSISLEGQQRHTYNIVVELKGKIERRGSCTVTIKTENHRNLYQITQWLNEKKAL